VLLVTADDKMPAPNTTTNGTAINIYSYNEFQAYEARLPLTAIDSYRWICSDEHKMHINTPCSSSVNGIQSAPDDWKVSSLGEYPYYGTTSYPVDYCLSEESESRCKVQFTLTIAILVTALNFLKAILIFYTALGTKENPLLTMGDAVASFLERKDETTRGMCLLSVRDVKAHDQYLLAGPQAWKGGQRRFKDVTSRTRRTVTFAL
jgi:hypothetical protein